MNKSEQALALHSSGSNCAQSVLGVFAQDLGLDPKDAHKLSTGLGAGLGRSQLLCGAVSGGALALGAAFGNDDGADQAGKERAYAVLREYVRRIQAEFPRTGCRELLGVDLQTEEGRAAFKSQGLLASVCDRIIAQSVRIVEDLIREPPRAR